MAIKGWKEKITTMASGENLGEAAASFEDRDLEETPSPPKKKKTKKERVENEGGNNVEQKRIKGKKPTGKQSKSMANNDGTFNINNKTSKKAIDTSIKSSNLIDGYENILNLLGIKPEINLDLDFYSDDLDYVEFTQTQPIGFDFDEVTDFISRIKYNFYKLESALRQRDFDVKILASEVKKVEERMVSQNQEKELERMIGGMTPEERLIEENMNLKVEINELEMKLNKLTKEIESSKLKEMEVLQVENDIFKMNEHSGFPQTNTSLPDINSLPKLNSIGNESLNQNVEELDNMLKEIGGISYDK